MPTRSSSSSVLVWPDRDAVDRAAREWARNIVANHPEVLRIGYVGSYARGDWGVGSDLDLIMVVEHADSPWELRSASWDTTTLPVPADLIVYTENEWNALDPDRPFTQVLGNAVVWLTGC